MRDFLCVACKRPWGLGGDPLCQPLANASLISHRTCHAASSFPPRATIPCDSGKSEMLPAWSNILFCTFDLLPGSVICLLSNSSGERGAALSLYSSVCKDFKTLFLVLFWFLWGKCVWRGAWEKEFKKK